MALIVRGVGSTNSVHLDVAGVPCPCKAAKRSALAGSDPALASSFRIGTAAQATIAAET